AGERDDLGPLGDLEDFADRRTGELVGALGENRVGNGRVHGLIPNRACLVGRSSGNRRSARIRGRAAQVKLRILNQARPRSHGAAGSGAARSRSAYGRFAAPMKRAGSTRASFRLTFQCRCGPVARPVAPTRPTTAPRATSSPAFTSMADRWQNMLTKPWP